jgi:hypothetical protein
MLTSASEALIKKINIVKFFWNLCTQPLKNIKSIYSMHNFLLSLIICSFYLVKFYINLFPVFGTGYTLVNNMTKKTKLMLLIK